MSRWDAQFANHPIHTTIREIRELLQDEQQEPSAEAQTEKRRFVKVIDRLEAIMEQIDAEVLPFTTLDSINSGINNQNIKGQLATYSNNGNVTHLETANNTVSAQLLNIEHLAVALKSEADVKNKKSLEKSFDEFIETIGERRDELVAELEAVESKKDELERNLQELENKVTIKLDETDKFTNELKTEFSNAQNKREQIFDTWKSELTKTFETDTVGLIDENKSTLIENNENFTVEVDKLLLEAQEKHQSILDLHEIVAGDSVVAGYLSTVEDEKRQANIWRFVSFAFIVATAGWVLFTFFHQTNTSGDSISYWVQLLKTFSLSAVLLFGAIYASKQSQAHRQSERRTRWFALEVKAIDPFIKSLSIEDQKELKKELTQRLFGQKIEDDVSKDNNTDTGQLDSLVHKISDLIKLISK